MKEEGVDNGGGGREGRRERMKGGKEGGRERKRSY